MTRVALDRASDLLGVNELHRGPCRSFMQVVGLSGRIGSVLVAQVAVLICCTYLLYFAVSHARPLTFKRQPDYGEGHGLSGPSPDLSQAAAPPPFGPLITSSRET